MDSAPDRVTTTAVIVRVTSRDTDDFELFDHFNGQAYGVRLETGELLPLPACADMERVAQHVGQTFETQIELSREGKLFVFSMCL